MQSICGNKGSKTSFGEIVQLAKARRVDTVARLVSQLCPNKSGLGANNGIKNVGDQFDPFPVAKPKRLLCYCFCYYSRSI
ncbi:MAG: hypothetical protein DMG39_08635 [Acidobacteria bacterium]|nr:MAG: hypothetical protein DMG39_08635 [Acidobacteriota bacterium]